MVDFFLTYEIKNYYKLLFFIRYFLFITTFFEYHSVFFVRAYFTDVTSEINSLTSLLTWRWNYHSLWERGDYKYISWVYGDPDFSIHTIHP